MLSLLAAQYGTVSDIELVWTLIAFFGAIFSISNIRETFLDLRALDSVALKNGRGLLARLAFKSELARCTIQLIFFTIGVLAMFLPDIPYPPHTATTIIVAGAIFRWGLVISSVLIALKSYWSFQTRRELREQFDKREQLGKITSASIVEAERDAAVIVVPKRGSQPEEIRKEP